jgi:hypothetical protein
MAIRRAFGFPIFVGRYISTGTKITHGFLQSWENGMNPADLDQPILDSNLAMEKTR